MKAKIVIASTLKPVWDPRAYEKIGKSLVKSGKYEVSIIGSGVDVPDDNTIKFYNHQIDRSILSRVILQLKIYWQLLKIKPDLLIIGTHELILPAVFYKLFTGKQLVYDIRENYNYNLRYQKIYPAIVRNFLAWYIRTKEKFFQNSFAYFFLAEKCYLNEIPFLTKHDKRTLILENKAAHHFELKKRPENSRTELLFSGTISRNYGVIEAINFYQSLRAEEYTLNIIGHCPDGRLAEEIKRKIGNDENVDVELSQDPIPYTRITALYSTKTFGLLPYQPNKSTENKVPTKLFEYLANGIPLIISNNPTWCKLVNEYHGGICFDFKTTPEKDQLSRFFSLSIPDNNIDLQQLMWISQESQLLGAVKVILTN